MLFADASGSTKLCHERLGDTEALRAVDRCIKRMERAIDGFRAAVKTIGDEVIATFETAEAAFPGRRRNASSGSPTCLRFRRQADHRVGFHYGPQSRKTTTSSATRSIPRRASSSSLTSPSKSSPAPDHRRAAQLLKGTTRPGTAFGQGKPTESMSSRCSGTKPRS